MKTRAWLLYFLFLPPLSLALIAFSFLIAEPFPTILMPGFSSARDLNSEETSLERELFVIGQGTDDEVLVTPLQFAELDFTQSQASPIVDGIIREHASNDPELLDWTSERLVRIVGEEHCGQSVVVVTETVTTNSQTTEIIRNQTLGTIDLGRLQC